MNYAPILNSTLGLANMLAGATMNPIIIAGSAVITSFIEIMEEAFGSGGDNGLATELTALGNDIKAHMDELTTEVLIDIANQQISKDVDVLTSMAAEFHQDQQNISNALNEVTTPPRSDKQILSDFCAEVNRFQAKVDTVLSGASSLSQAVQDCLASATKQQYYATLPLSLAITAFYSSYLKYASTIQLQLAAKTALASQKAGPLNLGAVEIVNSLNTSRYLILQQAINAILPIVQGLNADVTARQQAADAVQVNSVALAVAEGNSGTQENGYGALSSGNLGVVNLLARGRARCISWQNDTSSRNLYLLSSQNILSVNYSLSLLNQAAQQCYLTLPVNPKNPIPPPPSSLPNIYPPPPNFQPGGTDAGAAVQKSVSDAIARLAEQYGKSLRSMKNQLLGLSNVMDGSLLTTAAAQIYNPISQNEAYTDLLKRLTHSYDAND
jgi:hypothetical protein